ncbi:hypothetical protein K438DRAFT_1834458 [Mycena galopus ATCC 62051]|nr:hypothetical protein K438DRAFT_1834458 [Mycena galopus ATCC 62051]
MENQGSEVTGLNTEAKRLFNAGKFDDAAKAYELVIKADTSNSPIHLSNLALVQLKLEQFFKAEISATQALMRDSRFPKARYRRGIARWRQGHLMEALVDFTSVLAADPMDKGSAAAFATISTEYENLGPHRPWLTPMGILRAHYPSAYGPGAAPRRPGTAQIVSRAHGAIVIPAFAESVPRNLRGGICSSCKSAKTDIKTCRCSTAVYCDEMCQRKHWPIHKIVCSGYAEDHVLAMRLCKNLLDHSYVRLHLLLYATKSVGALNHAGRPPYLCILLVFVKMVPLTTGAPRRRVSITNMVTAPLSILGEQSMTAYMAQLQQMRDTCAIPSAPGVYMVVTPHFRDNEPEGCRETSFMHRLIPELITAVTQSRFPVGLESHSFGVSQKFTLDLDGLYWNLEDELANDANNYYGLQG